MMTDDLIPVPEAERRYGLSRRSIRRLYERDLVQLHKRVGSRASLVSVAELERALPLRAPPGRKPKLARDGAA